MNDCIDLRLWAKEHRYKWAYEQSYYAEQPELRGDGRWYVEVLCRNGKIYPFGGDMLLAYASRGVKKRIGEIPNVVHHQTDGDSEVFKFPAVRLDWVGSVLRPKRLPGSARISNGHRKILQKYAFRGGQKK